MIKKTLYFGNPAYLSLRDNQLVIKLPEVESNDTLPDSMKREAVRTIPIEDIGVVVIDNQRITLTSAALEALLENNCSVITCNGRSMPVGLLLPLVGNERTCYVTDLQCFSFQSTSDIVQAGKTWKST